MKRARFRLATVMRVRRIQEDIELARLTRARLDVAAALSKENERRAAYRDAVNVLAPAVSTDRFLAERSRFDRMGSQVMTARDEVTGAREEEVARHGDWAVAAQRVSALDRLFDRHVEAHRTALSAEEIQESDERTMQRRLHLNRETAAVAPSDSPCRSTSPISPAGKIR